MASNPFDVIPIRLILVSILISGVSVQQFVPDKPDLIKDDLGRTFEEIHHICSQNEPYGFAPNVTNVTGYFDSAFMLSDDTFFKMDERIWKMNFTRYNADTILGKVSNNTNERLRRVGNIEYFLNDRFDYFKSYYAFDYRYDYVCNESNGNCSHLFWTEEVPESSFVCFYAYKRNEPELSIEAFMYHKRVRLMDIEDYSLRGAVLHFCTDSYERVYEVTLSNDTSPGRSPQPFNCSKEHITGWSIPDERNPNVTGVWVYWGCTQEETIGLMQQNYQFNSITERKMNPQTKKWEPLPLKSIFTNYRTTEIATYHINKNIEPIEFGPFIPITFNESVFVLSFHDDVLARALFSPLFSWKFTHVDKKGVEKPLARDETFVFPRDTRSKIKQFDNSYLSLGFLLRCPEYVPEPKTFDPNSFCKLKHFDNIFSLGDDIYFVANYKIWRYYWLGSFSRVEVLNPNHPEHKKVSIDDPQLNIRYDSFTTNLLIDKFDITKHITGFALIVPDGCDKYVDREKHKKQYSCKFDPDKKDWLHLTCIYGTDYEGKFTWMSYINTPAGLKPHRDSKYQSRDTTKCYTIIEKLIKNKYERAVISVSNFQAEFEFWNDGPRGVHGDQVFKYWIRFHYLLGGTATVDFYTRVGIFRQYLYDQSTSMEWVETLDIYTHISDMQQPYKQIRGRAPMAHPPPGYDGTFYFKPQDVYLYYKKNTFNTKIRMDSDVYDPYRPFNKMKLNELMKCDRNTKLSTMTYSLVPIQNPFQHICQPFDKPNFLQGFSAFNIGEYVYFQIAKLFFRYVPKEDKEFNEGFVYDKQVSEILNDIFDTSERVVGYSFVYKFNPKSVNYVDFAYYRVVLFGKPTPHYLSLLNSKLIYRYFWKQIGPHAPLLPLNHDFHAKIYPIGVPVYTCKDIPGYFTCPVDKTFNKRTLDGIAFLQVLNPNDTLGHYDEKDVPTGSLKPTFYAAIIDTNRAYYTTDINALFTQPLYFNEKDDETGEEFPRVHPFTKVYGMFGYKRQLFVLGTIEKDLWPTTKADIVPYLVDISMERATRDSDGVSSKRFWQPRNKDNLRDSIEWIPSPIGSIFNCWATFGPYFKNYTQAISSKTRYSSASKMIFIFICLIIILVFVVSLIGYLAFKKYEPHKQKAERHQN